VVRRNKLSGHREEKGVSWDLQEGVQTLERYNFKAGPRERIARKLQPEA